MSSIKQQLEDAVITILNSGSFSQEFTAIRGPQSIKRMETVPGLQVVVWALPVERIRLARRTYSIQWTFEIGVGLFWKVGFQDGEVDPDGVESVNVIAEEFADALDVKLTLPTATPMGNLVPKVDYEPDSELWGKGIVTAEVTAKQIVTVDRPGTPGT